MTKISCSDQVHDASRRYDRNGNGPRPFPPTQRVDAARHDHALGPGSSSAGPFFASRAGTWARGRGWALWKALITLAKLDESLHASDPSTRTIRHLLDDHRRECGH
ncbi:hypothetical protein OHZ10_22390 [Burkholderia arboris]|uniref:Uncharacterized protein n=1 Tax=Burkholderia arboris TaxID=488730 RepID=A0ABZ3DUV2_9BURK